MRTVRFSRQPAARRGQTLTEFALVVPVLCMLIMGVLDGALLMFSVGTARYASTEGSRLAAQLGNVSTTDAQVVDKVRSTVGTTQLFSVSEVDIYRLNQDGAGNLTPDLAHYNRYRLDGTALGPISWPPSSRNVSSGSTDFLGLTVHYSYTWKAGFFSPIGPIVTTADAYVRLEPQSY
jgi:Flp pilus assembly protein TadG